MRFYEDFVTCAVDIDVCHLVNILIIVLFTNNMVESANVTSSAYSGMIPNLEKELKVELTVDLSKQETKAEAIVS